MEDENRFTFHNSSLPMRSYDFFQTVRQDKELCDIILRVGNQTISAHRLIIAAAIPYFRNSYSSEVSESEESDFPDVDPAAFEILLDYAYTYKIVITTENVKNLLYGAYLLHVEEVQEACCNFLIDRMSPENVLNIRNFARDLKYTKLLEYTDIYVRENFADVAKTDEFLKLSVVYMSQLLESDELHVANEEKVFEALMKWIKTYPEVRKIHLPQLLKAVRMPFLSPVYLKKHVVKDDMVRASHACRDLLDEARDFHDFPEERSGCSFSTVTRIYSKSSNDSEVVTEEIMYVVYPEYVFTAKYLENETRLWKQKGKGTFVYGGPLTAVVGDKLFLLRGPNVISYGTVDNIFNRCATMPSSRFFAGAVQLSGKIYVCGGKSDFGASNVVECYDPKMNKWEKISNMRERRESPGVATLGKYMYVSGGSSDSVVHKSVEKYDPRDGRWAFVPPMLSERYGPGFAALNGKLYASGGKMSDFKCTTSAEVYDPAENKWSFIAPMNSAKVGFKLLPYCGKLYAIGGFDDKLKGLNTVEIYYSRTGEWRSEETIELASFVSAEVVISSPLLRKK